MTSILPSHLTSQLQNPISVVKHCKRMSNQMRHCIVNIYCLHGFLILKKLKGETDCLDTCNRIHASNYDKRWRGGGGSEMGHVPPEIKPI